MDQLAGWKGPTHYALRLDKTDVSRAVMDKFYRSEEVEWENNPYICRIKELGLRQSERKINFLCG